MLGHRENQPIRANGRKRAHSKRNRRKEPNSKRHKRDLRPIRDSINRKPKTLHKIHQKHTQPSLERAPRIVHTFTKLTKSLKTH